MFDWKDVDITNSIIPITGPSLSRLRWWHHLRLPIQFHNHHEIFRVTIDNLEGHDYCTVRFQGTVRITGQRHPLIGYYDLTTRLGFLLINQERFEDVDPKLLDYESCLD